MRKLPPQTITTTELSQPIASFGQWQVMLNGDVVCTDHDYRIERVQLDAIGEFNNWCSWLQDKHWFIKSDFDSACKYARDMPDARKTVVFRLNQVS